MKYENGEYEIYNYNKQKGYEYDQYAPNNNKTKNYAPNKYSHNDNDNMQRKQLHGD